MTPADIQLRRAANTFVELLKSGKRQNRTKSKKNTRHEKAARVEQVMSDIFDKSGLAEAIHSLVNERVQALLQANKPQEPDTSIGISAERIYQATAGATSLLSIGEFAAKMQISGQTVRNREAVNELFSITRPNAKRGRLYPEFQLYKEVQGEPLKQILAALKEAPAELKHAFFTTRNEHLSGFTPLEVLMQLTLAAIPYGELTAAKSLINASPEDRLAKVFAAASKFAA